MVWTALTGATGDQWWRKAREGKSMGKNASAALGFGWVGCEQRGFIAQKTLRSCSIVEAEGFSAPRGASRFQEWGFHRPLRKLPGISVRPERWWWN